MSLTNEMVSPGQVQLVCRDNRAWLYADGAHGWRWYNIAPADANAPDWQGNDEDTPTYRELATAGSWIYNEATGIHCN